MSQGRIVVVEPNGVRRSLPLPPRGLSIGRGPDNDLVLGYDFTSRHHARITFEGGKYYVVDLDSANGTYMAEVRLSPHSPAIWSPQKTLRIGQVTFQLEQVPVQSREPGAFDPTETRIGWLPEESPSPARSRNKSRIGLLFWLTLAGFCLLAALGGGYYYFFS